MVACAVESMGGTVVGAGLVAPRGIGAKVQQQGPAPQPWVRQVQPDTLRGVGRCRPADVGQGWRYRRGVL